MTDGSVGILPRSGSGHLTLLLSRSILPEAMCGAATFLTQDNLQTLIADFRVTQVRVDHDLLPNYNLRPMQKALIIREVEGERVLEEAQWWLVPQFELEPKTKLTTFNARAEKLMQGMFRPYFLNSRALFVADSYYEWLRTGDKRLPFRFLLEGGNHFAIAALYALWKSKDETFQLLTCAVITTSANELGASIHPRMPAILEASQYAAWLDPKNRDVATLSSMLRPFPPARMSVYPVSTIVNSGRVNSPQCIAPVLE